MNEKLIQKIQNDFDRIALLEEKTWNHNSRYHDYLLKQLPQHCQSILEIGCGTGAFSRLLAQRTDEIIAIDLSPKMIEVAKKLSGDYPNINFQITDILQWEFPIQQFDAVVAIATFHHLPIEELLVKLKATLKPGGKLVVLDLVKNEGMGGILNDVVAAPLNWVIEMVKNQGRKPTPEAIIAWREHFLTDEFLTLSQAKQIYRSLLTGVIVRKHLFWRYSVVWEKQ